MQKTCFICLKLISTNPKSLNKQYKVVSLFSMLLHTTGYKYNDTVEATISVVKKIVDVCIRSKIVKRLIYTASVVAASPLKDDGSGYNTTIDESCWTPLHLNVPYRNDFTKDYTQAKTKAEQEILKIGKEKAGELEVVTLGCGLVGGGGYIPYASTSVLMLQSQVMNDLTHYGTLRYLEELLGKIPIVHIEDVCRGHIFCAETPSVNGRLLCASSYVSSAEIAKYFQENYPQFHLKQEVLVLGTLKDTREKSNGAPRSLKIMVLLTSTI